MNNLEIKNQRSYWPTEVWKVSTPGEQGMNPSYLQELDRNISESMPHLRGVLVIRHGYIVYEKYSNGYEKHDFYDVWSVTKSIVSALTGIAIQKGLIQNVEQPVSDFFPEYCIKDISLFKEVKIKHLLQMTSGFQWNISEAYSWFKTGDWVKSALEDKFSSTPGRDFCYSNQSAHVMSAIITRASGMRTREFAQRYLFDPLGISKIKWEADPKGIEFGGAGLFLSARDMAKFGYLYLNEGLWDQQEVVPRQWIVESTCAHSDGGGPEKEKYGYLWWVHQEKGHHAYFASGYGGQYIYVLPELDTVVVTVSSSYTGHRDNRNIVGSYIVPSIK